jgi:hypothetical protein
MLYEIQRMRVITEYYRVETDDLDALKKQVAGEEYFNIATPDETNVMEPNIKIYPVDLEEEYTP